MSIPDNIIPLVYLVAVAGIAGGLTYIGVSPEMTGLIIGAGITRVKASPSVPTPTSATLTTTQTTSTDPQQIPQK
jgi:hypothetical protein